MLVIENIRNIKEIYNVNKNESINCEVKFQCFDEYVPYTASINDSEEIGRNIHRLCLSGIYGEIYPPLLPTLEDNMKLSETERNLLLLKSSRIIEPLKDASEGGYIDEEDIDKLEKWKKYRYQLTKVNLEEENIQWPKKPD
ncbi:tail fiber assembly protein [Proteus columbae]|uniref:tail fiber assembly protein n=1 Tax=Proteus columbae TaxID=1987580 RepID=UPI0034D653F3